MPTKDESAVRNVIIHFIEKEFADHPPILKIMAPQKGVFFRSTAPVQLFNDKNYIEQFVTYCTQAVLRRIAADRAMQPDYLTLPIEAHAIAIFNPIFEYDLPSGKYKSKSGTYFLPPLDTSHSQHSFAPQDSSFPTPESRADFLKHPESYKNLYKSFAITNLEPGLSAKKLCYFFMPEFDILAQYYERQNPHLWQNLVLNTIVLQINEIQRNPDWEWYKLHRKLFIELNNDFQRQLKELTRS